MVIIERPRDLAQWVGKPFPTQGWLTITQEMIDKFADATGDHQWIHCDPERAGRESPFGTTIAHGYLILSLLGRLQPEIYEVHSVKNAINYGVNKLRFLTPVKCGAKVRLQETPSAVEPIKGGVRLVSEVAIEIDGESKPAAVAEVIFLLFEQSDNQEEK